MRRMTVSPRRFGLRGLALVLALVVLGVFPLGVYGTSGLRVVDASSMPYVTNGNIYAPVMMLAERGADLVLGQTPLAPEHVAYYRHRDHVPGAHTPGAPAQEPETVRA